MIQVALLVRLEAKPGKEQEVENLLRSGLSIVQSELETITWYAIRLGSSTFGIFDTFPSDTARNTHLSGQLAAILMAKAAEGLGEGADAKIKQYLTARVRFF